LAGNLPIAIVRNLSKSKSYPLKNLLNKILTNHHECIKNTKKCTTSLGKKILKMSTHLNNNNKKKKK
jgi:hypothetical protein